MNRYVSAAELTAAPDSVAPVSGVRCRECGHNAYRDDAGAKWCIEDGAAYCSECRPAATAQPESLPEKQEEWLRNHSRKVADTMLGRPE